ncbi:hypothetical protein CUJ84_Chr001821 [Rhizobium leguminosarum]|jgi:hypothetical protein|uniref:Uncharacterized protein n=1 Tax=Rhizobium leguminosarum TaxID=384 RepID=A0A2K9Z1S2_RHILE|nr:hypothetical protein CUJ84_Chr001821 [Rhizobium leguminosarum]
MKTGYASVAGLFVSTFAAAPAWDRPGTFLVFPVHAGHFLIAVSDRGLKISLL